ncbi:hypothetical protein ACIF9R_14625 [Streptomyces sp. NPDC086080]|uniref:hypothetical protein n=1 Tax=Streptomyces sp. NPDC086080 TaxID=3365748 RepID=UPI0037D09A88
MTSALRTALTAARARSTARHLADVRFCASCAQVSTGADRAAERRQRTRPTTFIHAG